MVARRRTALPIEEVVAILGGLFHIHVKRTEGVGPLLNRDLWPVDLRPQLLRVENVAIVNREPTGVFAGVNDIGDDRDIPRQNIPALATELSEVAGLKVGFEENLGRRRVAPGKGA